MSWNLTLAETPGKKVQCTITPDPSDPDHLEYEFTTEEASDNGNPFSSKLIVKKTAGHDNGGTLSATSVFECCPQSGGCENSNYCMFEVVDQSAPGNPVKVRKRSMNKVSSQI